VANPIESGSLLTCATEESATPQWTEVLTSCVVLSLKVALAMNICVCPAATVADAGMIETDDTVAELTTTSMVPVTKPLVTVMVVVPALSPVMTPFASTDATDGTDELKLTVEVRSCVLPLL